MKTLVAVVATILIIITGSFAYSALTASKPNVAACVYEDGSTQYRCHWDADTQGNGVGKSFTSYNYGATVVYDK